MRRKKAPATEAAPEKRPKSVAWKPEKTCIVCGRVFCITDEWVYVRGSHEQMRYFCSWHCLREYDRTHETIRGKPPSEKKTAILKLRKQGLSYTEISLKLNISEAMVKYYDLNYGG